MAADSPIVVDSLHERWLSGLRGAKKSVPNAIALVAEGRLRRMVGLALEAEGCEAAVGDLCSIVPAIGNNSPDDRFMPEPAAIDAEVVGFADDRLFLMPTGRVQGLTGNMRVKPARRSSNVLVGESLLGRVVDGAGKPLDRKPLVSSGTTVPLHGQPINPLQREPISQAFDVGVRSINSLLTIGRGQRVGLFAGSGVGKSVLLGMMTRFSEADVVVVGLIGERGREVREFIENSIGAVGMRRAVVVASPADDPPLMRLHGAMLATAIAEHFRNQGLNVLLLMDSLTRFAQAQREIALSIGEPPVTRGYPPSVFSKLPQLCERAGNGPGKAIDSRLGGSITAIYTVLAEGDDQNDPVADAARAILDGHIVLSRDIAAAGLFPAIDVASSASRTMDQVSDAEHLAHARLFRKLYAAYQEHQDLLSIGAYQHGSNIDVDMAIALWPKMQSFLQQEESIASNFTDSLALLRELFPQSPSATESTDESLSSSD